MANMLFPSRILLLSVIALLGCASVASARTVRASVDTVYERQYSNLHMGSEVHIVNRGVEPVRLDSLEVRVDRKRFPTLALDFSLSFSVGLERHYQKIFFWSETPGTSWLSQPLQVPPGDSVRIYMMRIDRCPKCNGRPVDLSAASSEIIAPLVFRSRARPQDSVGVVVRGWYLKP